MRQAMQAAALKTPLSMLSILPLMSFVKRNNNMFFVTPPDLYAMYVLRCFSFTLEVLCTSSIFEFFIKGPNP